jgi:hypothetical protein
MASTSNMPAKISSVVSMTPTVTSDVEDRDREEREERDRDAFDVPPIGMCLQEQCQEEYEEEDTRKDKGDCGGDCNDCECYIERKEGEDDEDYSDMPDLTPLYEYEYKPSLVEERQEATRADDYSSIREIPGVVFQQTDKEDEIEFSFPDVDLKTSLHPLFRPDIFNSIQEECTLVYMILAMYKVDAFIAGIITNMYAPVVSKATLAYVAFLPTLLFIRNPDWIPTLSRDHTILLPAVFIALALSTSGSLAYIYQMF